MMGREELKERREHTAFYSYFALVDKQPQPQGGKGKKRGGKEEGRKLALAYQFLHELNGRGGGREKASGKEKKKGVVCSPNPTTRVRLSSERRLGAHGRGRFVLASRWTRKKE